MSSHHSESDLAAMDRRSDERRASQARALVTVEGKQIEALIENESGEGLFVVIEGALEMDVEWTTESGPRAARARLRRVTTLPGQRSGWGLELLAGEQDG